VARNKTGISMELRNSVTNIESIALKFTEQDTPRGWKTLDTLGVSLQVLRAGKGLVYVFSSSHWDPVRHVLEKSSIPYWYKRSPGFSKSTLEEHHSWLKGVK